MNSLPPERRGVGAGMSATFQNSAMMLSIGIFFTLIILGLASSLPVTLTHGLVAQGVPRERAGARAPRCRTGPTRPSLPRSRRERLPCGARDAGRIVVTPGQDRHKEFPEGVPDDRQAFLGRVRLPRPAPPGAFLLRAARAADYQGRR